VVDAKKVPKSAKKRIRTRVYLCKIVLKNLATEVRKVSPLGRTRPKAAGVSFRKRPPSSDSERTLAQQAESSEL
jgi:hypothetical protein